MTACGRNPNLCELLSQSEEIIPLTRIYIKEEQLEVDNISHEEAINRHMTKSQSNGTVFCNVNEEKLEVKQFIKQEMPDTDVNCGDEKVVVPNILPFKSELRSNEYIFFTENGDCEMKPHLNRNKENEEEIEEFLHEEVDIKVEDNKMGKKTCTSNACSETAILDHSKELPLKYYTTEDAAGNAILQYVSQENEEESGDGENVVLSNNAKEAIEEKFGWDHNSIILLLDEYHKRVEKFRNPKVKKKNMWLEIAAVMNTFGYKVDADSLDRKMRNMRGTFNKIKDNNKTKRPGKGRVSWEYYRKFEEIFAQDKTINPTTAISSVPSDTPESGPSHECNAVTNTCVTSPNTGDDSRSNTPTSTATFVTREKQVKWDKLRKRQIAVEEKKLEELKKIRKAIEECNSINREKVYLLRQFIETRNLNP